MTARSYLRVGSRDYVEIPRGPRPMLLVLLRNRDGKRIEYHFDLTKHAIGEADVAMTGDLLRARMAALVEELDRCALAEVKQL